MLTKNKNSKVGYIGRILALPLTLLVFAAFTLKAKPFKNSDHPVYNGKKITVVIDAGHGGADAGARSINGSITEKELTLAIIKKIKALNSNANIILVLTRETDVFQTVQEKADFTKAQNADLFVSIHVDATSPDSADYKTGLSVYVAKDNFANASSSKLFASAVISEFKNKFPLPVSDLPQQREIGIKVLQESNCPSVLIEAGYITNKNDLAYLKTDAGKETIASNILAAINRYAFAKEKELTMVIQSSSNTKTITAKKTDTVPEINLKNYDNALIIADGEIISNAALKKIKSEDIKSIEILKGKSATDIYGEKGKSGVIVIQSKVKELVYKELPVTLTDDTSAINGTISGRIKIRGHQIQDPAKQPLYIIDGNIQTGQFELNAIDPNDIQSINVIKGEGTLKKYGEAGKNGVVEITTKKYLTINDLRITKVPETDPLREVVMVGYGTFDITKKQTPNEEHIFTKTEKEPRFPGGQPAWERFLQKNLNANMPIEEGWKPGVYKITVSFIVRKDGSVADIKTSDYPGSKTSEHCIDLIRKGPRWEPAVQNGHPVNAYRKQPLTFLVEKK